ncbi:MAG: sel1 repeat family protein [Oscillospiraceae bacterium]|nr:sel1 repeat family protein [Oscillospiraceae bacterium]
MSEPYYKPCPELSACLEVDKFWTSEEFTKFFEGYLKIATETGYPLAECQTGFCYLEGIGTEKNPEKALYWTELSAKHGDRDGQCNLAWIYEEGLCGVIDMEKAKEWYKNAALQNHDLAIEKCKELEIEL